MFLETLTGIVCANARLLQYHEARLTLIIANMMPKGGVHIRSCVHVCVYIMLVAFGILYTFKVHFHNN